MNLSINGYKFMVVWFLTTISLNCMIGNICSNNHFVSSTTYSSSLSGSSILSSSLKTLKRPDEQSAKDIDEAAKDFGNMTYNPPSQVVYPKSVSEISDTIKRVFDAGAKSNLTIAARGQGHSVQGQAAARGGVVVVMPSLQQVMNFSTAGGDPYVDVSGGELWINVLKESVKHGLSPKSWTDYLNLTVGGTLSNAGVSGQTFRHGPQIDNVYELEVVTGKGEVITCSENRNADLFYGVLGGLGQLGIITRARISLQPAPVTVKWIQVLYSDFSNFTKDQEHLISSEDTFDYIEGFVVLNGTDPNVPYEANQFQPDGKFLFCLEVVKYYNPGETGVDQTIERLLSELSYTKTIQKENASYVDFLDRLHKTEMDLRKKGLWEVPHPWLNLLIPKSRIHDFANQVFGNILTDTNNGPLLIYPANKSKWDNRTSAAIPDEDVFYQVAFLSSAVPASSLEHILTLNKRILDFCRTASIGVKVYIPHYTTRKEWQAHFGSKWGDFVRRKSIYDPLAILAPGQQIFPKGKVFSNT